MLIAAIVILLASLGTLSKKSPASTPAPASSSAWQSYTEDDYDFSLSLPKNWIYQDSLTKKACCLFVAYWENSTTTSMATTSLSTSTPIPVEKVTSREFIKLQIGGYDRKVQDPFKAGTTTKMRIGEYDWYVGSSGALTFYLLPRNDNEGLGVAQFIYTETTKEQIETAKKIISTIKLLPMTDATSTAR